MPPLFPRLQGRGTTPATTTTMSYADRLKTNVRHDQRLKRNVLEITIEKEKEVRIELDPATVARIMHSIGLDIGNQVEGYQIIYGKVCIISVWVVQAESIPRQVLPEGEHYCEQKGGYRDHQARRQKRCHRHSCRS